MNHMFKQVGILISMGVTMVLGSIPDATHPDFKITKIPLPGNFKTTGMGFLKNGKLAIATIAEIGAEKADTNTKVLLITGAQNTDASLIKVEEVANNFAHLAGLVVANDKLYVSDKVGFYEIPQLTLPVTPGNNRQLIVKWPDENTWGPGGFQWHQWSFSPLFYQGFFYAPYSGSINQDASSNIGPTSALSGAFLKWDLGGKLEAYAGGLRSPNGAGLDEATGEMYVTDNQGSWLPSCTFARMRPGKFYGHRNGPANFAESLPYEPPVAWLPYRTISVSASQPVKIPTGKYAGDWLIGDVTFPGLMRVAIDRAGETYNGAVFFFSQGFQDAAINRLTFGPDNALYIGTIATIAQQWPGGNEQPLFRMTQNVNATAFEMRSVKSVADGLELTFTLPVDDATVQPSTFSVGHSQNIRESGYGQGGQPGQNLSVTKTEVSNDHLRVHLVIPGLIVDRVVYIKHMGLTGSGKAPWNNESWFTLNTISTRAWNGTATTEILNQPLLKNSQAFQYAISSAGNVSVTLYGSGLWSAELITPLGKVAEKKWGIGQGQIQFSALKTKGLYFLKVSSEGKSQIRKLVLE